MTETLSCDLTLPVTYDPDRTDPESLCAALDTLLETAMSTPGILEEYGEVSVSAFQLQPEHSQDTDPNLSVIHHLDGDTLQFHRHAEVIMLCDSADIPRRIWIPINSEYAGLLALFALKEVRDETG